MKRIGMMVLVLVLFAGAASAQGVEAGAKAGGSITWLSGSDWDDTLEFLGATNGTKFRFVGGAYMSVYFVETFGLQMEALFSQLGGAYEYDVVLSDGSVIEVDGEVTGNALELPVMFKGRAPVGEGYLYAAGGPDVFVIPGSITYREEGGGFDTSDDEQPDNRVLFGLALGGGVQFAAGPGFFDLGIRYGRTLSSIYDDSFSDDIFANTVGFTLGYAAVF